MAVTPHPPRPSSAQRPAELRDRERNPHSVSLPLAPNRRRKLAGRSVFAVLLVLAVITGSLAGLMIVYSADLPQIEELEHYRPSTITDLYDRKGRIIGSFALERREVIGYDDFAPVLRQAVVSIEDKNFWSHWGVNVFRVAGAALHDVRNHGRTQGASTLTMQLARNLFLSSDRTMKRKLQEAYLAIQIERAFTKQQIFTLYGNQIYLGSGMYGFEAASQFYFSKPARDLTLTEAALLAGLPKGPAAYSPILNPDKALRRRNLVLSEMESDGAITHAQAEEARSAPLGLHVAEPVSAVAPWFQDEVRQELERRFGSEQVHEAGLRVDTTLDLDLQQTANRAVADGLAAYERRHGWKGNLENVLSSGADPARYKHPDWAVQYAAGDYVHALVTRVLPLEIRARVGTDEIVLLPEDWKWTGIRLADALARPGDILYVHLGSAMLGAARRATLEQDSGAEGSLLAIDNTGGDVLAMVGGRDYALSVFNRTTQAERQTGSSFKPYVYTAAIEDGIKPTDTVLDSPARFGDYVPHNYENDYRGRMTVLNAFAESRNIPALRLASHVGIHKVIDMAHRFGVTSNIPAYLPVAIGAVEITMEEQVASYAVFPNEGVRVAPRLIRKVSNADGITLWEDTPTVTQVIDPDTAHTMMTLLEAVTQHGTAAAAAQLNHPLGGKTGTTSNFTDAWFLGFSPSVTCGVWVGYDNRQSLGDKETGARAALPIWMTFMKAAIAGKDDERFLDGSDGQSSDRAQAQPAGLHPGPHAAPSLSVANSSARAGRSASAVKSSMAPAAMAAKPVSAPTAASAGKPALRPSSNPMAKPALTVPATAAQPMKQIKPALPTSQ